MTHGMLSRVADLAPGFSRKRIGRQDQLDATLLYLVSGASQAVTGTEIDDDRYRAPPPLRRG